MDLTFGLTPPKVRARRSCSGLRPAYPAPPTKLPTKGQAIKIFRIFFRIKIERRIRIAIRRSPPQARSRRSNERAKLTCAEAVKWLIRDKRRWEVRSAGKGSKGERWYAWAWIATASSRHHLLIRHHLKTGELAFHYWSRWSRWSRQRTRLNRDNALVS